MGRAAWRLPCPGRGERFHGLGLPRGWRPPPSAMAPPDPRSRRSPATGIRREGETPAAAAPSTCSATLRGRICRLPAVRYRRDGVQYRGDLDGSARPYLGRRMQFDAYHYGDSYTGNHTGRIMEAAARTAVMAVPISCRGRSSGYRRSCSYLHSVCWYGWCPSLGASPRRPWARLWTGSRSMRHGDALQASAGQYRQTYDQMVAPAPRPLHAMNAPPASDPPVERQSGVSVARLGYKPHYPPRRVVLERGRVADVQGRVADAPGRVSWLDTAERSAVAYPHKLLDPRSSTEPSRCASDCSASQDSSVS
jgi:hypothetical protein